MGGLSVGMKITKDDRDGPNRIIKEARLVEVSVHPFPANEVAQIDVVKFEEETIETIKDFEYCLRDVGVTHKQAKTLVSQFKAVCLRDVGDQSERVKELEDELMTLKTSIEGRERIARITQLVNS